MAHDVDLLPLSNCLSLRAQDVGLICSHLQTSYRPSLISFPDRSGPRFIHNQAGLGSLKFHGISYGSRTLIKSPPTQDSYLVVMPIVGQGNFKRGKNSFIAKRGNIVVFNPSDILEIELSENFQQIAIQIPKDSIQKNVSEQLGYRLEYPLVFKPLNGIPPKIGNSLKALIEVMVEDLNTNHALSNNSYTALHAEKVIISLLLEGSENNYKEYLTNEKHVCRPKYVKRAEAYIRENYDRNITIEQLTNDIGITPRSLQMGFKKYLATTPTNYIKNIRLERAREILTSPSPTPLNITNVALSCGFNHLSNFIKYYKEAYGVTPSATLIDR